MFGLTGAQANHGEDVKEYWWYLDAVPSHAWNRWRYHYPQGAFPYDDLIAENGRRGKFDPEYELLDTGVVRRRPLLGRRGRLRQGRPRRPDHGRSGHQRRTRRRDAPRAADGVVPQHVELGPRCAKPSLRRAARRRHRDRAPVLRRARAVGRRPARTARRRRRCSATTRPTSAACTAPIRARRTRRTGSTTTSCGATPPSTPTREGTKVSLWYQLEVAAGAYRRAPAAPAAGRSQAQEPSSALGKDVDRVVALRRKEADEFYAELTPPDRSADEAAVMRQAFAGMLWSKQLYAYDVQRWLDGDPTQPVPPAARLSRTQLPLAELRLVRHHVDARQVGVPVVRGVGPRLPLRRAGPRRPGVRQVPAAADLPGVVPAPERCPARLRVGLRRRQPAGAGVGGARGVRHRRRPRPRLPQPGVRQAARELHVVGEPGGRRRQQPVRGRLPRARQHRPDRPFAPAGRRHARAVRRHRAGWRSTRWRWATIGTILHRAGQRPATDLVLKFLEHFADIRRAMDTSGVWDEADGLYYDKLVDTGRHRSADEGPLDGRHHPAAGRPSCSTRGSSTAPRRSARASPSCSSSSEAGHGPRPSRGSCGASRATGSCCSAWSASTTCRRLFGQLFDEDEFLSPYGLRAVSAYHRDHPYELDVEGIRATIDYEPAESTTNDVRRQLELAGADLVPAQLPVDQRHRALRTVLRRRPPPSSTRPAAGRRLTPGQDRR